MMKICRYIYTFNCTSSSILTLNRVNYKVTASIYMQYKITCDNDTMLPVQQFLALYYWAY